MPCDIALVDLRLPDIDGLALFTQMRKMLPELPVVFITAFSSVTGAVEAMKAGAFDYVTKPFNMEELTITVLRALETTDLRSRLSAQVILQKTQFGLDNILGKSPAMCALKELVRRIAQSESTTVLLLGESGTGKDMVARAIHYESNRADEPFMNLTCSALPESLLESELFGHERGAFTDAKRQKKGLFELADGGTVFMDEIGEMSLALQAKLLRVLEEKAFKRVGGTADILVDVRVIAATNRNLEEAIGRSEFREDLYYRLHILPMVIPPLRDRAEDIPLFADHFLHLFNTEFHHNFRGFSAGARRKMLAHAWPGNVRELRNVIERAVLLARGDTIEAEGILLGPTVLGDANKGKRYAFALPPEGCNLEDVERDLLIQALERTQWNQSRACELLGLTRDQIRHRIAKFELSRTQ